MKILKAFVSLSMFLSILVVFSVVAAAKEIRSHDETLYIQTNTTRYVESKSYLSYFSSGAFNFYDQLDEGQKTIYDALKDISPTSKQVNITLNQPVTFKAAGTNPTPKEKQAAIAEVSHRVQGALDALLKDFPELFWLKFGQDGCTYEMQMSGKPLSGGYLFSIKSITFNTVIMNTYAPIKDTIVSTLNNVVQSFPVVGQSRFEKVLSIHDELANRIAYDKTFSFERAYDAYGALVDGLAVCEGYSEAFKLLCDKNSIPCVLVVGTGITSAVPGPHMWNMVQMEDGKWYGVDVTWNDQTEDHGKIFYDFFLVGKNTKDTSFGNKMFYKSHQASGFISDTENSMEFGYPLLSLTAYEPGQGNTTESTKSENKTSLPVIVPPMPTFTTGQPLITTTTKATTGTKKATNRTTVNITTVKAKSEKTTSVKANKMHEQTLACMTGTDQQSDATLSTSSNNIKTENNNSGNFSVLSIVPYGLVLMLIIAIILYIVKKRI